MAGLHGLSGLLYVNLERLPPGVVPAQPLAELAERFHGVAAGNLPLARQLIDILDALAAHDIPVVAFKGPVLGVLAYGHLALREFSDLDILVRRVDLRRAAEVLEGLGLQTTHRRRLAERIHVPVQKHYLFAAPGAHLAPVELHWEVFRWRYAAPFDTDALLGRSQPVSLAGGVARTLSPEDLVLVLAMHGAIHGWRRLAWICDVAELVTRHPALDWETVLTEARGLGLERTLYLALRLAADLLGAELPSALALGIRRDPVVAELAAGLRPRLFSRSYLRRRRRVMWMHVAMRERVADRVRYLARSWI